MHGEDSRVGVVTCLVGWRTQYSCLMWRASKTEKIPQHPKSSFMVFRLPAITTASSAILEPYMIHNGTREPCPRDLAKPRSGVGPASQAPWYGNFQSGHEVHISTEGQSCALSALSVANLHLDDEEVTPHFLLHFGRCNGSQAVARR